MDETYVGDGQIRTMNPDGLSACLDRGETAT